MKKKSLHLQSIKLLPEGKGWLLCEFGGETKEEATAKAKTLMAQLSRGSNPPKMRLFEDEQETQMVWKARESGLAANSRVPGEAGHVARDRKATRRHGHRGRHPKLSLVRRRGG